MSARVSQYRYVGLGNGAVYTLSFFLRETISMLGSRDEGSRGSGALSEWTGPWAVVLGGEKELVARVAVGTI